MDSGSVCRCLSVGGRLMWFGCEGHACNDVHGAALRHLTAELRRDALGAAGPVTHDHVREWLIAYPVALFPRCAYLVGTSTGLGEVHAAPESVRRSRHSTSCRSPDGDMWTPCPRRWRGRRVGGRRGRLGLRRTAIPTQGRYVVTNWLDRLRSAYHIALSRTCAPTTP